MEHKQATNLSQQLMIPKIIPECPFWDCLIKEELDTWSQMDLEDLPELPVLIPEIALTEITPVAMKDQLIFKEKILEESNWWADQIKKKMEIGSISPQNLIIETVINQENNYVAPLCRSMYVLKQFFMFIYLIY